MAEEFQEAFVAEKLKLLADLLLNVPIVRMQLREVRFVRVNLPKTEIALVQAADDV